RRRPPRRTFPPSPQAVSGSGGGWARRFPGSLESRAAARRGGAGCSGPPPGSRRAGSCVPPVLEVPLAERLLRGGRQLAVPAPGVERVVEQKPRQVRHGRLADGLGGVEER